MTRAPSGRGPRQCFAVPDFRSGTRGTDDPRQVVAEHSGACRARRSVFARPAALRAAEAQPQLTGDTRIHDPSVIEVDGRFVAVGTGQQGPTHGAIRAKTSPDGIAWTDAGVIGKGPPEWAAAVLGFQALNVWAPSISRRGGTFFLYYCLSGFGDNASAIGLMTNTVFDPAKPSEGWRDQGMVVMSKHGDDFNAIDPFRIDASDGRAWLAFGSFWSGIKLSELDPVTGKIVRDEAPRIALAGRKRGAIEASSVLEHDGNSISSSASTSAARASPRLTTFASAAQSGSRARIGIRKARI